MLLGMNKFFKPKIDKTAVDGTPPQAHAFFTFNLDPGAMVTQNVAWYPLHHAAYSGTKFEVATTNGLGGDAFTRIYII